MHTYLEMQMRHFYARRRFVPCYGVIPGATSQSFFGLRHFHWYVWTTLGLKGKDVHLNWCDVLEPGFGVFFQKKQLMETSPKVAVVIPKHYGVISQHYGVTSWNHDRIHFPLFLLLMDLQSPWRRGVLYWSGYWDHIFVSQAYAW